MPNIPGGLPGTEGPWGKGIYDTVGPVGIPQPEPVGVFKAWQLLLDQLGVTNVRYAKASNAHLRSVNHLIRR